LYLISAITLFIEIYVIWLIVHKTTQKMQSFRYHLMSLMVNLFLDTLSQISSYFVPTFPFSQKALASSTRHRMFGYFDILVFP
jgi:hypothetical protein